MRYRYKLVLGQFGSFLNSDSDSEKSNTFIWPVYDLDDPFIWLRNNKSDAIIVQAIAVIE